MAQFDPPVQINPDVPDAQKWSFVNQNFLTLGNAVNSTIQNDVFKIVTKGVATIPGVTITLAAGTYGHVSSSVAVAHGQGHVPAIIAFESTGGAYQAMPIYGWDQGNTTGYLNRGVTWSADTTNINFFLDIDGYNRSNSFSAVQVTYYILQETAS
jgi:hypothetical protein